VKSRGPLALAVYANGAPYNRDDGFSGLVWNDITGNDAEDSFVITGIVMKMKALTFGRKAGVLDFQRTMHNVPVVDILTGLFNSWGFLIDDWNSKLLFRKLGH
jgi:hypothetical protein